VPTLGQGFNPLLEHALQAGSRDGHVDGFRGCCILQAAYAGDEGQELQGRHVRIGGCAFRQIADAALGFELLFDHVVTADRDPALAWGKEPGDHFHGGGFAGSVGTQEAKHLTLAYTQSDAAYGCEVSEPPDQVFDDDHGFAG
jgi:hypothetical protein